MRYCLAMNDWPAAQPLDTTRLHLEPLNVAHAREMAQVLADTSLYRYIGGTPPTVQRLTERYARQSLGHSPMENKAGSTGLSAAKTLPQQLALCKPPSWFTRISESSEIAWVIGSQHQGKGYATEASNRMVAWLHARSYTLIAHIHPRNQASAAVAHKLGLSATETIVDGEVCWEASLP
jgi:RimJ/RimL family protein N-acetyltransferase